MLTFDKSEDIKKIHEIRELANMKVRTEMFNMGKLIHVKDAKDMGHRNFVSVIQYA